MTTDILFWAFLFFTIMIFIFKAIHDKITMMEKRVHEMRDMVREIEEMARRLNHIDNMLDTAIVDLENARHIIQNPLNPTTNPCNEIILEPEEKILNNPLDFFDMRENMETTTVK